MQRFFLAPAQCQSECLSLSGAEAHHALGVLRVRTGERVVVLNGAGDEFLCEVLETGRRALTLRVLQRQQTPPLPHQVTLVQAVARGRSMDVIVRKATELGAGRVMPVLSERSVPDWTQAERVVKQARWRAAAVEAIKQCGSAWLPEIDEPLDVPAALGAVAGTELSFLASLQPGARHPREWIEGFLAEHGRLPRTLSVWVGPEGDFTAAEMNLIRGGGALPITLGPLILRSETAALYCLATLRYELEAPRPYRSLPAP